MTDLVGREIVEARKMTEAELEREGWATNHYHPAPPVLVLDDGTNLYPATDTEGNSPGALFGVGDEGEAFRVEVSDER